MDTQQKACLGDGVCSRSMLSVKDIIKKYEPENSSFSNITSNTDQSSAKLNTEKIINEHTYNECNNLESQKSVGDSDPFKNIMNWRKAVDVEKLSSENGKRGQSLFVCKNKSITTRTDEENDFNEEGSYKSRTSIFKTKNGVKIVTDILYNDTKGKHSSDIWVGRRIETEVPPSQILSDL